MKIIPAALLLSLVIPAFVASARAEATPNLMPQPVEFGGGKKGKHKPTPTPTPKPKPGPRDDGEGDQ